MNRLIWSSIPLLCLIVLSSCYLPDKYETEINITDEGIIETSFKGKLILIPLFMELKKTNKKLSKNEIEDLKISLGREPGVREVEYDGAGIFTTEIVEKRRLENGLNIHFPSFVKLLSVTSNKGTVRLRSPRVDEDFQKQLHEANLGSVGTICIKTNARVVTSNADSEPGLISRCHEWNFDLARGKKRIDIILRLKNYEEWQARQREEETKAKKIAEAKRVAMRVVGTNLTGKWKGRFHCGGRMQWLAWDIQTDEIGNAVVTSHFYPVDKNTSTNMDGVFRMTGNFDEQGNIALKPTDWIKRPDQDVALFNAKGSISKSGKEIIGRIQHSSCVKFQLRPTS